MSKKKRGEKKSTLPYRTISLPNDIYKDIESHVKEHIEYVSIANFVRYAIREKIKADRHPLFNPNPIILTEKEKEAKVFFEKYMDEKFKTDMEKYIDKKFTALMKKQIRKDVKEERKQKKNNNVRI